MDNGEKNCQDPWFSLIATGQKKVEGRLNRGFFATMKKGSHVTFVNHQLGFRRACYCCVTSVKDYPSFAEYLDAEGLDRCLPTVQTIAEGVSVYRRFFSESEEKESGVRAVRIRVLKKKSDECKTE